MSLVTFPRQFLVDVNGRPRVGAKAYFYRSGTSTPIVTYTTATYDTPHSNPVLSLGGGLFPAVYVNSEDNPAYKIVVTDANDVELYSNDAVPALGFTGDDLARLLYPQTAEESAASVTPTNYAYPPGNVLRYGAGPSESAATNDSAIAAALLANHEVVFPYIADGIYNISAPLVLGLFGQRLRGEAVGSGLGPTDQGVVLNVVEGFPTSGGDVAQSVVVTTNRYQHVSGLTIDCNNIAEHGLYGEGGLVTHGHYSDINIIEPAGDGVLMRSSTWMNRFDMVRVTTGQGWGFNFDALTGADGHTTISLRNCYVSGALSLGGFRFDAVSGFTMDACAVDSSQGWVIQMVQGSQGVTSGMNCEGSARLFDLSDASSLRQRLVVNGGRFINYGSNSSPPDSIIDNGGFIDVRGVQFSTTRAFTAFMEARSNSVTAWKGNALRLFDLNNVLNNSAYVDADNVIQLSNNSAPEERLIIRAASTPRIQLSETGHTVNLRDWQIVADAGVLRFQTLDSDGAVLANILTFNRSNNRWTIAGLANYADDSAAEAAGVAVGGLYRNGSVVMVRVS